MQDDCSEPAAKRARMDAAQPGPASDSANPDSAPPTAPNCADTADGGAGAGAAAAGTAAGPGSAPAAAAANGGAAGGREQWMGGNVWLEEGVPPPLAPQRAAACYVCELPAIPGRHAGRVQGLGLLGLAILAPFQYG